MVTKKASPLLSVFVLAYNHRDFIERAIEGMLMQKTDFVFDIVIGEDQSTDGTREIVLEYGKKISGKKLKWFLPIRTWA